jgi:hypothetical protein
VQAGGAFLEQPTKAPSYYKLSLVINVWPNFGSLVTFPGKYEDPCAVQIKLISSVLGSGNAGEVDDHREHQRMSRLMMKRTGNRYMAIVNATFTGHAFSRLRLGGLRAFLHYLHETRASDWTSWYRESHMPSPLALQQIQLSH